MNLRLMEFLPDRSNRNQVANFSCCYNGDASHDKTRRMSESTPSLPRNNGFAPRAGDLRTIVPLFIIFRLVLILLYTPQGLFNAYTNFQFYYRIAQFAERGFYPLVNMWYEYPPLSAYIPEAAYLYVRHILPFGDLLSFTYAFYARILGCLLLAFETGVLILLHQIASGVWGARRADWLAWVYALLSLPLFYSITSQDSIVVFFLLLSMYLFLSGRLNLSAGALGLGAATKLTPIFLLGPVAQYLWSARRALIRYVVLAALFGFLVYLPFLLLGGGPWIVASFRSLLNHDSWYTVWALLDGNWASGTVGALDARLDLAQAGAMVAHPAAISGLVSTVAFGLIYLALWIWLSKRKEAKHFLWFTLLTAMLFHLWSKGWSAQWATLLIPLILLAFPDRLGMWLVLALTGIVLLEWPLAEVIWIPVSSQPGSNLVLAVSIIGRTVLFIVIAILAVRRLRGIGGPGTLEAEAA
jgi:hypothetical protein